MYFCKNFLSLMAIFGLFTALGLSSPALAQETGSADITVTSNSAESADGLSLAGACDLPLGGNLYVTNNTNETIVMSGSKPVQFV